MEVEQIYARLVEQSGDFDGKLSKEHVRAMMQAVEETADEMIAAYGDLDKAFLFACQDDGVLAMVIVLHRRGANPNIIVDGLTPLFVAASQGHTQVVEYLLEIGVDPDQRTEEGATPLIIAAKNGHLDIVKLLINNGADVDARADNGATAMAVALEQDQIKVINALVEAGAKPAQSRSADDWVLQIETEDLVNFMNIQTGQVIEDPREASVMPYEAAAMIARESTKRARKNGVDQGRIVAVRHAQAIEKYLQG